MLSLSALCYILEKVEVGLPDKVYLLFIKSAWVVLSMSDFSQCCVISGFLFFLRPNALSFFLFSSFAQYWPGYVSLPLENYLVTLKQKRTLLFPYSSKGKGFLDVGPWLDSMNECHADTLKALFSHGRAEGILLKELGISHLGLYSAWCLNIYTHKFRT